MPFPKPVSAAQATLAWDANTEPNLAGYIVHYGTVSGDYQYSVSVGNTTSCTISGLQEGKKYYFSATAYNIDNMESDYADEIAYTIPVKDTDGDGLSDDTEINVYGTDPDRADTDADGINDKEELNYWGNNWNADVDGDGLFNLIDPDADNDGVQDGIEINSESDPADSGSYPSPQPASSTVYEDAEDGTVSGWNVYAGDSTNAGIKNIYDADKNSRVIQLTGSGTAIGFRLRNEDFTNWQNSNQFIIEWSMKSNEFFYIYIDVETAAGHRYIFYTPDDQDNLGSNDYVHHGLGSSVIDGQWHTVVRDLQADLKDGQPNNQILEINAFLIRGSGCVDNIKLK